MKHFYISHMRNNSAAKSFILILILSIFLTAASLTAYAAPNNMATDSTSVGEGIEQDMNTEYTTVKDAGSMKTKVILTIDAVRNTSRQSPKTGSKQGLFIPCIVLTTGWSVLMLSLTKLKTPKRKTN